jgi:signal transduction histidine kinase
MNNLSPQTILVVDDNPTNLAVITEFLESQGFMVSVARDGEMALRTASYALPDLILLDVMMPGIDGFETCRQLKADSALAHIPVIFMTALSSTEDKVNGFTVGAVDYVTKPIQQEEVLARVQTHLRIQALKAGLQSANEQLAVQNQQLAELIASKDKFFSIISHDLRTPFNTLMGMSQLLMFGVGSSADEQTRELAEKIYDSAETTYSLLGNLLSWAQMQRGHMSYDPDCVSLNTSVQKTMDLLQETALNKDIKLVNNLNGDFTVYADENMLNTVLRNLTSNALKFTQLAGTVNIGTKMDTLNSTPHVVVSIQDTGVGINPDNLRKLFRIDSDHTTMGTAQESGSGLGLVLCKEMVEHNKGQIWIESEVGKGTTVHFTVPLQSP